MFAQHYNIVVPATITLSPSGIKLEGSRHRKGDKEISYTIAGLGECKYNENKSKEYCKVILAYSMDNTDLKRLAPEDVNIKIDSRGVQATTNFGTDKEDGKLDLSCFQWKNIKKFFHKDTKAIKFTLGVSLSNWQPEVLTNCNVISIDNVLYAAGSWMIISAGKDDEKKVTKRPKLAYGEEDLLSLLANRYHNSPDGFQKSFESDRVSIQIMVGQPSSSRDDLFGYIPSDY